jgi:transposase
MIFPRFARHSVKSIKYNHEELSETVVNRKAYTKEFKEQAVELIKTSDQPASKIAKDLGINANMLRRWRDELDNSNDHAFPGQGHRQPGTELEEENRRLKEELLTVRMERDILKKAMAIFSKPQQ